MPLFECTRCGTVDNTALSPTFWRKHTDRVPVLCTECETGTWHGEWEKQTVAQYEAKWGPGSVKYRAGGQRG